MISHVIAYRSTELLFGMHTFNFNCFFDDFNSVFTQISCLSRLLHVYTELCSEVLTSKHEESAVLMDRSQLTAGPVYHAATA